MIDVKSDLKEAKLNKHKKIIPMPAPRLDPLRVVYKDSSIDELDSMPMTRNKPWGAELSNNNTVFYACIGLFAITILVLAILVCVQ